MPLQGDAKREYNRKWLAARRAEYFDNKVCVICGSTKRLELDHIDPTQKVSHRIFSWSQIKKEAELAKCQILCHDCHLEKTVHQRKLDSPLVHGSYRMYDKEKCRCIECRVFYSTHRKLWPSLNR